MKLSICMMVKNEEKNLRRCLDSLKPIMSRISSELIIVDTGSTDSTINIAQEYTEKLFFHTWNNDFSEMRNITIGYANAEWILIIDADEEVEENRDIIRFLENEEIQKSYNVCSMKVVSITNDSLEETSSLISPRLFRNDGYFKYEGSVHNTPIFKGPGLNLDSIILHYGYNSSDKELMEKKFLRTSSLLKKELIKDPNNIYYRYQLSASYAMHKDWDEALKEIQEVFKVVKKLKLNPKNYLYIYGQYVICLLNKKKYDKAYEICLQGIEFDSEYIDLYFFLGQILKSQNKYGEAIESYCKYLKLLKDFERLSIRGNLAITFYSLDKEPEVLCELAYLYFDLNQHQKALITSIEFFKSYISCSTNLIYQVINIFIESALFIREIESLSIVYDELFKLDEVKLHFQKKLEQIIPQKEYMFEVIRVFGKKQDNYGKLNKIRLAYKENRLDELKVLIINLEENINWIKIPNFYGDLIYFLLILKQPILSIMKKIPYDKFDSFYYYLSSRYENIRFLFNVNLTLYKSNNNNFQEIRTRKMILRNLILSFNNEDSKEISELFDSYIQDGIAYMESIYKPIVFDSCLVEDMKNAEEKFFLYITVAFRNIESNNKLEAIKLLRMAYCFFPEMGTGIKLLIERIEEKNTVGEELALYLTEAKKNLEKLISMNLLDASSQILKELEEIYGNDLDLISMKSVVLLKQNNIDDAQKILKNALKIYRNNFDLTFNLAYSFEAKGEFENALKYYLLAKERCNDKCILKSLDNNIDLITEKVLYIESTRKKRIIFFVKKGMDNFINDIIDNLSNDYETRKMIVDEYSQIDEGMQWADICWFEWCDELIIYGSTREDAKSKRIICRLHSYEAFTSYPQNVKWENVDLLIFIGEHLKQLVHSKLNVSPQKTIVIPNGIDLHKYSYKERSSGFNIAYVGYINYKKGPMLLLHTFKSLCNRDYRYKLFIAGNFQDERDFLYFKQMIREMDLENNIFIEGWQKDLNSWLEDKNYIICTSILESQNTSVMQAMAKGIKPIIHNFVGAKEIYPELYIWNSIEEAVNMILNKEYRSFEYRSAVESRYSSKRQINNIKKVLQCITK